MTTPTPAQLLDAVKVAKQMREAQRQFYRYRTGGGPDKQTALRAALQLEARFDRTIKDWQLDEGQADGIS